MVFMSARCTRMACPALHACARVSAEERPWRGQRDACAPVGVVRSRLRNHARSVLVRAEQLHDVLWRRGASARGWQVHECIGQGARCGATPLRTLSALRAYTSAAAIHVQVTTAASKKSEPEKQVKRTRNSEVRM